MSSLKPKISLIISTYNWPEALELVFKSVLQQSVYPLEVIIADDGSGPETQTVIEDFKAQISIPIKHVWHEDKGFRLAKIRNKAIAIAEGEYIIQIDGDMILHPHFIKDHLTFSKKNAFTRASRIYIEKEKSTEMLYLKLSKINVFNKGITNTFSALRIPFLWRFFEKNYKNKGDELYEIHGCNMAFWREDAIKVNGYNELFNGWGPEDKEFVARLINLGVEKRFLKLGGLAFHIHHKENEKTYLAENEKAFKETITLHKTFCEIGINQYL